MTKIKHRQRHHPHYRLFLLPPLASLALLTACGITPQSPESRAHLDAYVEQLDKAQPAQEATAHPGEPDSAHQTAMVNTAGMPTTATDSVAAPLASPPRNAGPAIISDGEAAPGYYVQAAAFANEGNALRLREQLMESQSSPVVVISDPSSGTLLYKVQLGPFKSLQEAMSMEAPLHDAGFERLRFIKR